MNKSRIQLSFGFIGSMMMTFLTDEFVTELDSSFSGRQELHSMFYTDYAEYYADTLNDNLI